MAVDSFSQSAGGSMAVIWSDGVSPAMKQAKEKTLRAAHITAQSMAPEVENYMKINAPWTDQTGNARNGLAARAYRDKDEIGIVLYHQVTYGIWLETRFGGKYAIIEPTIQAMSPKIMARYERILDRI
jgi:hypothetical protein